MGLKKEKKNQMESKKKKTVHDKDRNQKKRKKNSAIQTNTFAFMAFYCSKWFQEFTVGTDGSSGFT